MNIVFVTYHTCARANKMAWALMESGHQVVVLQHLAASEDILYDQPLSAFYRDREGLVERIPLLDEWADIYHVHNEPDWPVHVIKAHTQRPVIYDCHDLDSQRKGEANPDEILAFKAADGLIFPSKAYALGAMNYHGSPKPYAVVYSMCLKSDITAGKSHFPFIDAIAYEGHHIGPVEGYGPGHPLYYGYRDYRDFVAQCTVRQVGVALYGTRAEHKATYRKLGAMVFGLIPYADMMRDLARYPWGFCGHPESHPQWEKAMPNKLFEYLAAGIPVIAWNCAEVESWVQKHDIGVVVNSYNELQAACFNRDLQADKQTNLSKLIREGMFTMESQARTIEALYAKTLANLKEAAA